MQKQFFKIRQEQSAMPYCLLLQSQSIFSQTNMATVVDNYRYFLFKSTYPLCAPVAFFAFLKFKVLLHTGAIW